MQEIKTPFWRSPLHLQGIGRRIVQSSVEVITRLLLRAIKQEGTFPIRDSEPSVEKRTRSKGKSKRSRSPSKDRGRPNCKSSSHTSQSSDSSSDLSYFDPGSLVKNKEGTFKPSKSMERYLQKHFRRCISKEEWDAVIKEHPSQTLTHVLCLK